MHHTFILHITIHGTFIPSALPALILISYQTASHISGYTNPGHPLTLKVMRSYIRNTRIWPGVQLLRLQGRGFSLGIGIERPWRRHRSCLETQFLYSTHSVTVLEG